MAIQNKESMPQNLEKPVDALYAEIVKCIRTKSEAGQLVTSDEIFEGLVEKGVLKSGSEGDRETSGTFLKDVIKKNEDLREISNKKGDLHYFSTSGMTEAYAGILIQKGEDPLVMMAETVRENSRRYPRPVRLDIFEEPPFSLTPQEVSLCLKRMAEQEEYQDIAQTTTSVGTVFLFSRLHLEPDYASMLAEWYDVGQSKSP
jgi:hypothetical protein